MVNLDSRRRRRFYEPVSARPQIDSAGDAVAAHRSFFSLTL